MKTELLQWHRDLVRSGYLALASRLLNCLRNNTGMSIGDGNEDAYESGFAYWLMDSVKCQHKQTHFVAALNSPA